MTRSPQRKQGRITKVLPDRNFWTDRRVCVTGGTGFLGWQIVRQLCDLGADVRILALLPDQTHTVHQHSIDACWGDVRDPDLVRRATDGCSIVFHTAGVVGAWGKILDRMWSVHVDGTANVIASSPRDARIVHTSSLTTVGASRRGEILNEEASSQSSSHKLIYVRAKQTAEQLAIDAAAAGRDVVITNPGYLVGPEDYERSIMGRFCVRFWKGRVPMSPPGGLSLVDVRDVATGHLLAAEKGKTGHRYILGGENHRFPSILRMLARVAGCRPRALPRIPWLLLAAVASLAELRSKITGREPYPSLGHVRLNRHCWFGDSSRAAVELGYNFRPLFNSLHDAYQWHHGNEPIRARGLPRWWLRPAV
jgi:dihydroflavonol-4-reductase